MGRHECSCKDSALEAPRYIYRPGEKYSSENVRFQSIPTIIKTPGGRLWVACSSGGTDEGPENYIVFYKSDDGGKTWGKEEFVIDHFCPVRLFDPILWYDPKGRLWLFWNQAYHWWDGRGGVFAAVCDGEDTDRPMWSEPRRLADGVMTSKPVVRSDGAWMFCISVWSNCRSILHSLPEKQVSGLYLSFDEANTLEFAGGVDAPGRSFDENIVIERKDGSLWMLIRLKAGVGEALSLDGGKTWGEPRVSDIKGPSSRFAAITLSSGRIILINHYNFTGRNNMTAMLSEDDGRTWPYTLLLDERENVSYPDVYEAENGLIYAVYDRGRYDEKEILAAVFTEKDIIAGRIEDPRSALKLLVNKAGGAPVPKEERTRRMGELENDFIKAELWNNYLKEQEK